MAKFGEKNVTIGHMQQKAQKQDLFSVFVTRNCNCICKAA